MDLALREIMGKFSIIIFKAYYFWLIYWHILFEYTCSYISISLIKFLLSLIINYVSLNVMSPKRDAEHFGLICFSLTLAQFADCLE